MLTARAIRAGEGVQSLPQGDGMLTREWELLLIIPLGIALGYAGLYLVYLVHA